MGRAGDVAAAQRLKSLVAPFVLRRLKTDKQIIQDLPEKNEMKVYCTLTREQATLYQAAVQDALREIEESEGIQRRGLVLGLLTRLKQLCDHPALFLHDASTVPGRSGKLARLDQMLDEVRLADAVVGTSEAWLTERSNQELRELLALRRDAVPEG